MRFPTHPMPGRYVSSYRVDITLLEFSTVRPFQHDHCKSWNYSQTTLFYTWLNNYIAQSEGLGLGTIGPGSVLSASAIGLELVL